MFYTLNHQDSPRHARFFWLTVHYPLNIELPIFAH